MATSVDMQVNVTTVQTDKPDFVACNLQCRHSVWKSNLRKRSDLSLSVLTQKEQRIPAMMEGSEQPCIPVSDWWCCGKVTRRVGISSDLLYAGVSFGTEIATCLAPSLVDLYVRYGPVSLRWPFWFGLGFRGRENILLNLPLFPKWLSKNARQLFCTESPLTFTLSSLPSPHNAAP